MALAWQDAIFQSGPSTVQSFMPSQCWAWPTYGMESRTRLGPGLVTKFVNRPRPGVSLARRFYAGLAPSLEISTRDTSLSAKQILSPVQKFSGLALVPHRNAERFIAKLAPGLAISNQDRALSAKQKMSSIIERDISGRICQAWGQFHNKLPSQAWARPETTDKHVHQTKPKLGLALYCRTSARPGNFYSGYITPSLTIVLQLNAEPGLGLIW